MVGNTAQDVALRELVKTLPVMDKPMMMEHFNELNTAGLDRDTALEVAIRSEKDRDFSADIDGISVGLSSGTSGHRGLFVVSKAERAEWAGTILALALPKRKILGHKIALFLRAGNQLYDSIGSRAVHFEYFDIYKPLTENLAALNALQPTILVAPPSVLRDIAAAQEAGNISVAPQKIFTAAEVLEPIDERYFKRVFKHDIIHQIYQCTEGLLGVTCQYGTMHLNEDAAIFEKQYVDSHRFIPIVTDYRRTTQPIVRYRLGDILVEKQGKCLCGNPATAIDRIEGRSGDTLELTDADDYSATIYADMVSRAMLYADGVEEYRIVQREPGAIDVYIRPQSGVARLVCEDSVHTELTALLNRFNLGQLTINYHTYTRDTSAKMRRVERAF
jgi:putative adenylate-forming enzyme